MKNNNLTGNMSVLSTTKHIHSELEVIIISGSGALFSLVTCIGNLFVVLAYKLTPPLQTITHLFIFSMAISDFLVGLISINFYMVYLALNRWPLGASVCQIWLCLDHILCQASCFHLIVICLDRYFSAKYPLKYRPYRTRGRSYVALFLVWLISVVIWLPVMASYPYIVGGSKVPDDKCYVQFTADSVAATLITSILAFYIPILIIAIIYVRVFMIIKQRNIDFAQRTQKKRISRKIPEDQGLPHGNSGRRNALTGPPPDLNAAIQYSMLLDEKKAATNMALIFLNFSISWAPFATLRVVQSSGHHIPVWVMDFSFMLVYINSTINPLCYALRHKLFRRAMLKILKRFKVHIKN